MKSDLKDCSCSISQMRQARVGVVEGQQAAESRPGIFFLPSYKTWGGKNVFEMSKQKCAVYRWAASPGSQVQELLLCSSPMEKIQQRLSKEFAACLRPSLPALGLGCGPVGRIQPELCRVMQRALVCRVGWCPPVPGRPAPR